MARLRSFTAAAGALCLLAACAAPIIPQRSKPGGSARWAVQLAVPKSQIWAADAQMSRITGVGVSTDGWLPDRGGTWQLEYWSPSKPGMFEVSVDSDGVVKSKEIPAGPHRGESLPADWLDTPKVWAATRVHQKTEPVHTFDAEFARDADPEHAKDQVVWRIRFWQADNTYSTHVVSANGTWLANY